MQDMNILIRGCPGIRCTGRLLPLLTTTKTLSSIGTRWASPCKPRSHWVTTVIMLKLQHSQLAARPPVMTGHHDRYVEKRCRTCTAHFMDTVLFMCSGKVCQWRATCGAACKLPNGPQHATHPAAVHGKGAAHIGHRREPHGCNLSNSIYRQVQRAQPSMHETPVRMRTTRITPYLALCDPTPSAVRNRSLPSSSWRYGNSCDAWHNQCQANKQRLQLVEKCICLNVCAPACQPHSYVNPGRGQAAMHSWLQQSWLLSQDQH